MINIADEQTKAVRAFLVGIAEETGQDENESTILFELSSLIRTLGMEVADKCVLQHRNMQPKFGIGSGKAAEIVNAAKEIEADCIICDFELSPTHQRNWEQLAQLPVFDRQEVILRIFASRAQTKEAVLQVELARLCYSLPRLAHMYGSMARQRGGNYGAKGSGETQLELDRRTVQQKIGRIRQRLAKVLKERETMRKRRNKVPVLSCTLVGYTNAGKSSLLNALTGADVFVEDKLFATLDPVTRRVHMPNGSNIVLTDTVGFISKLPHGLIDSFKSTLEETVFADILLIVLDASDLNVLLQYKTVIQVLDEIDAKQSVQIIVLNKTDATDFLILENLLMEFPQAVPVSATSKTGLKSLLTRIETAISGQSNKVLI